MVSENSLRYSVQYLGLGYDGAINIASQMLGNRQNLDVKTAISKDERRDTVFSVVCQQAS